MFRFFFIIFPPESDFYAYIHICGLFVCLFVCLFYINVPLKVNESPQRAMKTYLGIINYLV